MYDNIIQTSQGNPAQSTPGVGGFLGPGMDVWAAWPNTVSSVGSTGYTANRVIAVAFYLARPVTINHATIQISTSAGTTATANAGIYSAAGNLLVDTGAMNIDTTGTITQAAASFKVGGGLTIPAGTYYYAWAMTVTATVAIIGMGAPGSSQGDLVNAIGVNFGLTGSGNVLSGGALPATLGTLTGGNIALPCAFFCP